MKISHRRLFLNLFNAKNEGHIDEILNRYSHVFDKENWHPYGGNENNYGVIENQQSNPVAALVEKLTNAIDAIMMRRCYEEGIDPKSRAAPSSVEEGVEQFFPDYKNWDLSAQRRAQAQSIQVIADSKPRDTANTSLVVYDDGEGQHPDDFEQTFLSLLRGNKNEIHFVQGKYNMGGSGAIAFCGKKRYQLLASKRYDGSGDFGFTLIRQHPLTSEEADTKKNTWYEYLKIDGRIPSFPIDTLDLGLEGRLFTTGTIIKLYSYELKGNKNIRRDLRRSINEFLFAPALPVLMVEQKARYPKDRALTDIAYGLRGRLEGSEYIETTFSERFQDPVIGDMKVRVYVFKTRTKDKSAKDTKKTIRGEFFKNNMAVQFSMNGQVQAHYTTEFISRTLQYPLLRDYLLIHVDCTAMKYEFRKELFMASRDRLKQGDEANHLRRFLGKSLRGSRLKEIYKHRKDSISVEGSASGEDLLRSFAENLPISGDLRSLLSKTFKLDEKPKKPSRPKKPSSKGKKREKQPFNPQRFPSFFKIKASEQNGQKVIAIPLNGTKTVRFDTDVEDNYFDRSDDAGDMQVAILGRKRTPNSSDGGDDSGSKVEPKDLLSVNQKSPQEGTIKVVLEPAKDVKVGDEIEIRADLSSSADDFTEIFWVKITDPLPTQPEQIEADLEDEAIGLPQMIQVFENDESEEGVMTWDKLSEAGTGAEMDWNIVMYPLIEEGEKLQTIYINMSSNVLKDYLSKRRRVNEEQIQLAHRRYLSAVYFHTLFLYVINRKRQFFISQGEEEKHVDLADYLREIFSSYYAAFLLNFGTNELMDAIG